MKIYNVLETITDGNKIKEYMGLPVIIKKTNRERLVIDNNYEIYRHIANDKLVYIHIGQGQFNPDKHHRIGTYPWYVFKICIYKEVKKK